MKVLMINGSPKKNGTTARALKEIADELKVNGIDSEIMQVGNLEISGCIACYACRNTGKCIKKDIVNDVAEKMKDFDGLIIGSPVYYAGINGTLKSFLDRLFCSTGGFPNKPASAVCVARRGGTTVSIDEINKYFMISNMPVISSSYWNMVHGSNGEDAEKDLEGMQTMRNLAKNMAWLLKCIDTAKKNGVEEPKQEEKIKTNFIR